MDENIYYNKKKDRKFLILTIISFLLIALVFYLLNFFNINPINTLSLINKGEMSPAYGRDYIVSIMEDGIEQSFPELQIIINETLNTDMSESIQHVSLNSGENVFDWDRFFKFNTAFIKTPCDTRYVKFENYNETYFHNYPKNESNLAALMIKHLSGNANLIYDSNNYQDKKIKVNFSGADLSEKVKLHYTINIDETKANEMFTDLYGNIWNSKEFASFFKSDDDIQKKLGVENYTKTILDMIYNIKENGSIKGLTIGIVANKDYVESIAYDFEIQYNNGESSHELNISIAEYLKPLDSSYSPEDTFESLSIVEFEALTAHEKHNIGDEVEIDDSAMIIPSKTEEQTTTP